MIQLSIVPATLPDVPSLVQLINSAYRGESARQGWTHEAELIEGRQRIDTDTLEGLLQQSGVVMLKAVDQQQHLAGCVYLEQQETQLYLGMLTTDPARQGQGIGKQLLQAAEEHAYASGCTSIVMTVISVRSELIDWYRRHGYIPTGERAPFPDDGAFGRPRRPLEFVYLQKLIPARPVIQ